MAASNKYAKEFEAMVEGTRDGRESILEDIKGLLEMEAYTTITENYLMAEDLERFLLPDEIKYLQEVCADRKSNPNVLN